jgi:hypothetical protein
MATTKMVLTTAAQEVIGSSSGCTVFPSETCLYGTGVTDPGVYVLHSPSSSDRIIYDGSYGALWFKRYLSDVAVEIIIMKA